MGLGSFFTINKGHASDVSFAGGGKLLETRIIVFGNFLVGYFYALFDDLRRQGQQADLAIFRRGEKAFIIGQKGFLSFVVGFA